MKFSEIKKLNEKERENKIKELKIGLVKSRTGTQKQKGSQVRQIRKIIARIHTFNNQIKKGVGKEK
jgi:ribosomal protein L29